MDVMLGHKHKIEKNVLVFLNWPCLFIFWRLLICSAWRNKRYLMVGYMRGGKGDKQEETITCAGERLLI